MISILVWRIPKKIPFPSLPDNTTLLVNCLSESVSSFLLDFFFFLDLVFFFFLDLVKEDRRVLRSSLFCNKLETSSSSLPESLSESEDELEELELLSFFFFFDFDFLLGGSSFFFMTLSFFRRSPIATDFSSLFESSTGDFDLLLFLPSFLS